MQKIAGETGVVISSGEDQRGMVRTVAGGGNKVDPSADPRPGRHIDGLQLAGLNHRQQAVKPQRPVAFAVSQRPLSVLGKRAVAGEKQRTLPGAVA